MARDTAYCYFNQCQVDPISGIGQIKKEGNYTREETGIPLTELQELLDEGQVADIERNGERQKTERTKKRTYIHRDDSETMHQTAIRYLIISITLYSTGLFAQSPYLAGYVVLPSKDTLLGYIRAADRSYAQVYFKHALSEEKHLVYQPADLRSFYLSQTKEYYYSQIADIDVKPSALNELEGDPLPRTIRDTVLMPLLVRGKINLFRLYRNDRKQHFFLQKENGKLSELIQVKYQHPTGYTVTLDPYKDLLKELLADCPSVKGERVSFSEGALLKVIEQYNRCSEGTVSYTKEQARVGFHPYVWVGGSTTRLSFQGDDKNRSYYQFAANMPYQASLSPVVGIGLEIASAGSTYPFAGDVEVYWRRYGFSGTSEDHGQHVDVALAFSEIRVSYALKYLMRGKVRPFFRVGLSNGLVSVSENHMHAIRIPFQEELYTGEAVTIKGVNFGFLGAIGLRYKQLAAEVRYENSRMGAADTGTLLSLNVLNVIVSYSLAK